MRASGQRFELGLENDAGWDFWFRVRLSVWELNSSISFGVAGFWDFELVVWDSGLASGV